MNFQVKCFWERSFWTVRKHFFILLCSSLQQILPSSGTHLQVRGNIWVRLTFHVRRGSMLSTLLPFASWTTKSLRAHHLGDLLISYHIHCLSRRCFACWNHAREISEKSPSVVWHPECHEVAKSLIQSDLPVRWLCRQDVKNCVGWISSAGAFPLTAVAFRWAQVHGMADSLFFLESLFFSVLIWLHSGQSDSRWLFVPRFYGMNRKS